MKVVVTGADGFLGKNLVSHLSELPGLDLQLFTRSNALDQLPEFIDGASIVYHLIGVNRPKNTEEFAEGNVGITMALARAVASSSSKPHVVFASSVHAEQATPYGVSKYEAEQALISLAQQEGVPLSIYRFPNIFGKWSRPNYNSVIATFCHNIARELPIEISDPDSEISVVYIDDVVSFLITKLFERTPDSETIYESVSPIYNITVGKLAKKIHKFQEDRKAGIVDNTGRGLDRALYSTFIAHLPKESFKYQLVQHVDARGRFAEVLKTRESGQMSFFTAGEGVTRGGHYHHTKSEQFLVIRGEALFKFRCLATGEEFEIETVGGTPEVVQTIPGWVHDITNIGTSELVVMLWANEIFDPENPDTFAAELF